MFSFQKHFKPTQIPDVPENVLINLYQQKRDELFDSMSRYRSSSLFSMVLGLLIPFGGMVLFCNFQRMGFFLLVLVVTTLLFFGILWGISTIRCFVETKNQLQIVS